MSCLLCRFLGSRGRELPSQFFTFDPGNNSSTGKSPFSRQSKEGSCPLLLPINHVKSCLLTLSYVSESIQLFFFYTWSVWNTNPLCGRTKQKQWQSISGRWTLPSYRCSTSTRLTWIRKCVLVSSSPSTVLQSAHLVNHTTGMLSVALTPPKLPLSFHRRQLFLLQHLNCEVYKSARWCVNNTHMQNC